MEFGRDYGNASTVSKTPAAAPEMSAGEQIMTDHAQGTLNRVRSQGATGLNRFNSQYGEAGLQRRQQTALQNVDRGLEGANNLQDSAIEQYGTELSPAQQKALERVRGLRGASARAAAANNTADQHFEERMAGIAALSNAGAAAEQQGLQGIAQATNTRASINAQNDQLKSQHNSGIGSLVGMGIGMAMGGPMAGAIGGQAGAAIF